MKRKTQSKTQATDNSQSSLVENLSEEAIRKALRLDAIQHPATILPLATCVLSVVYLVLFSPSLGGALGAIIVLICSGVAAAGAFLWRYSVRYSGAYTGKVQEVMALEDQDRRETEQAEMKHLAEALRSGFSSLNSAEGLKALQDLVHEHEELQPILDRRKETDSLSLAQIPVLAEETYRQGLSVLADAFELTRAVDSSDQERLEAEIIELEREIESLRGDETEAPRVEIREATVVSHKERLELIDQHDLRIEKLLYQCQLCEASLHRSRIDFAALKADSAETSVSAVTKTLQKTINQAREVQEEVRMLGL